MLGPAALLVSFCWQRKRLDGSVTRRQYYFGAALRKLTQSSLSLAAKNVAGPARIGPAIQYPTDHLDDGGRGCVTPIGCGLREVA